MKLKKTMRERFPRKLKKQILKVMNRNVLNTLLSWSYEYYLNVEFISPNNIRVKAKYKWN